MSFFPIGEHRNEIIGADPKPDDVVVIWKQDSCFAFLISKIELIRRKNGVRFISRSRPDAGVQLNAFDGLPRRIDGGYDD